MPQGLLLKVKFVACLFSSLSEKSLFTWDPVKIGFFPLILLTWHSTILPDMDVDLAKDILLDFTQIESDFISQNYPHLNLQALATRCQWPGPDVCPNNVPIFSTFCRNQVLHSVFFFLTWQLRNIDVAGVCGRPQHFVVDGFVKPSYCFLKRHP